MMSNMTEKEPIVDKDARYDLRDAARLLGVCRSTLHTYIKCGDLAVGVHHYTGKKFVLGASILNFWRGEPMRKNRGK